MGWGYWDWTIIDLFAFFCAITSSGVFYLWYLVLLMRGAWMGYGIGMNSTLYYYNNFYDSILILLLLCPVCDGGDGRGDGMGENAVFSTIERVGKKQRTMTRTHPTRRTFPSNHCTHARRQTNILNSSLHANQPTNHNKQTLLHTTTQQPTKNNSQRHFFF